MDWFEIIILKFSSGVGVYPGRSGAAECGLAAPFEDLLLLAFRQSRQ